MINIIKNKNLKRLLIWNNLITNNKLKYISLLPNLREIGLIYLNNIKKISLEGIKITDEGLKYLPKNIVCLCLTNIGFDYLIELLKLKYLHFCDNNITKIGLIKYKKFSSLIHIYFYDKNINEYLKFGEENNIKYIRFATYTALKNRIIYYFCLL